MHRARIHVSSDAPESSEVTASVAAIDAGSNTTRPVVARADRARIPTLATGAAMTALGGGLRPGRTIAVETPGPVTLGVGMATEAREPGADRPVAARTAPCRMAASAAAPPAELGTGPVVEEAA